MKTYDHNNIEKKWQEEWKKVDLYRTPEDTTKPKCYVLDMFPYPSGEGLHVGHPKGYIATDVYSRMKTMQGFNVLHPMGWDAFGLPAEQFAIKNKIHPSVAVENNTRRFKEQLSIIGFNYDWGREINTTDPKFYKWTQWIFLKMFERGLAYESYEPINWCPKCQTGLANEDLENGKCERCETQVEKKPMRQWVLRITDYADRMLEDLSMLEWPSYIKESQRNWIGRSEGAEITFELSVPGQNDEAHTVTVFTTRPDTIFGVSYLAVSAELAQKWVDVGWKASAEVVTYIKTTLAENAVKSFEEKEKTGVFSGIYAINPANKEKVPLWVVNYVLGDVGTGAIMGVPAHDERDFEFANKYGLKVVKVIEPITGEKREKEEFRKSIVAFVENPKTGEILTLNWGKLGGSLLVGGGVLGAEGLISCAQREIQEETGYKNIKFIEQTEKIHHHYVALSKGVNREIEAVGLRFALLNEDQGEQVLERDEEGKFKVEWHSVSELNDLIKDPLHKLVFDRFAHGRIYTEEGILFNSGDFDGMSSVKAKKEIADFVKGRFVAKYRLKDWVFARQRYWGEPIPLVHCEKCGVVPVPEKDLPVLLPEVESYEPTGTGESPLADIPEWVNTSCPKCWGKAKRETNTMPQWAGSSWYYLRFMDPHNDKALVDKDKEAYWSPVDMYVGGAEHATRHLIYARFWHKFLYDIGVVNYEEPFKRLQNVGLILASDGRKMSKRWGNVVNPDDVVKMFGADTLRVYEMFMGPFNQSVAWSTDSIVGPRRFLERVWKLREKVLKNADETKLDSSVHKTIKKVTEDIASFSFNTAISTLMILVNEMEKAETVSESHYKILLLLLAPFAPHITQELWNDVVGEGLVHQAVWPTFDVAKTIEKETKIVVQVNGKVRDTIVLPAGTPDEDAKKIALERPHIVRWIENKEIVKIIHISGKLINIVLSE